MYLHFHSDPTSSGAEWGFRLTVEAPVCQATAEKLAAEPMADADGKPLAYDAGGDTWPLRWAQKALAGTELRPCDVVRALAVCF